MDESKIHDLTIAITKLQEHIDLLIEAILDVYQ
jgi:hypothetical protein